jgi:hypothetical protein
LFSATSGVKRGHDLGRKLESLASIRKKKALKRKNLKLRGSLLNFFKRNDDACVSNKDLGENESGEPVENKCEFFDDEIVREYRATAKDSCLKGPTSVK